MRGSNDVCFEITFLTFWTVKAKLDACFTPSHYMCMSFAEVPCENTWLIHVRDFMHK